MGTPYSYPSGPDNCENVPNCPLIEGPGNAGLVVVYCFWAFSAFTFAIFYCLRPSAIGGSASTAQKLSGRMRGLQSLPTRDDSDGDGRGHDEDADPEAGKANGNKNSPDSQNFAPNSLLQRPLRKNCFGRLCMILWRLISVGFMCFFAVLIADYYYDCELSGVDALCFFGSHPIFGDYATNSSYFICNWFMSLFWFGMNLMYKDKIHIWFMHPCSMSEADHLHIWTKNSHSNLDSTENLEKTNTLVLWMRKARKCLTSQELQDGRDCIVEIQVNAVGVPYFIFEATRYLYNPSSDLYQVPITSITGKSFADFHLEGKNGLSNDIVSNRQFVFGPNKIPFERRSVLKLFKDEIKTYFYLYQLMMYLVWFWFRYRESCFVSIMLFLIFSFFF